MSYVRGSNLSDQNFSLSSTMVNIVAQVIDALGLIFSILIYKSYIECTLN